MKISSMENISKINKIETHWIENLALEELNMEESGIIHMSDHLNPAHLLEEESIRFMDTLRERVELYVTKFNEFRGSQQSSGAQVKIFKISNTVNDFMLFRNSLRLIFARKANDLISIGFLVNGKDIFAPRLIEDDAFGAGVDQTHEIKAYLGPFNRISWRFMGEEVEIDAMVRHYLSDFLRNSSR